MTTIERVERKRGEAHSEEDIEAALTAYAFHGSLRRAERACGIPWNSIRTIKERHPERLERIKAKLHEHLAQHAESLAERYAQKQHELLDQFDPSELKPIEQARAAKDFGVAFAVSVDKSSLLRGRPTQIVETRDADQLFRKLRAAGIADIQDAEVVEDEQLPPPSGLATSAGTQDKGAREVEAEQDSTSSTT